jgi:hypothetical protein
MLWDIAMLPLRFLIIVECIVLAAIVMPFLLVGRIFGFIEPAELPS